MVASAIKQVADSDMTFSKRCSRIWPLYCQLNVLPLDLLITIEHAKIMYKFEKKMLPEVFDGYFRKPAHQHNTRFASTQNNFALVRMATVDSSCDGRRVVLNKMRRRVV